jgi:hypothetical protein
MVADAVIVEPVSTLKFPASREKNRDFFDSGAVYRLGGRFEPNDFGGLEPNSLLIGAGNFWARTGNSRNLTGNFAGHIPEIMVE